jgi:uncharacterized protein
MSVAVTLLYAALLGIVGFILQCLIGPMRGRYDVSLDHGGHKDLNEAIRRHANWVENVPYILLMMALIEINGAPHGWLHALGLLLLVSRTLHPIGMDANRMANPLRIAGMAGTVFATVGVIGTALYQVFVR